MALRGAAWWRALSLVHLTQPHTAAGAHQAVNITEEEDDPELGVGELNGWVLSAALGSMWLSPAKLVPKREGASAAPGTA